MATRKKIVTAVVAALAAAAVCVGGFFVWKKFGSGSSSSDKKVYVQKVSSVNTVSDFNLTANCFSGVIEAQEATKVKMDSSKTVSEILVKEGDTVKKGDKLFTYDVEAIQLQIDQAKLEVERMQYEMTSNKNQITQLENEKKTASQDAVISYNTQILSLQSDIAKTEYDIKAKNAEIKNLEKSSKNAFVTAPIDGTVKDVKAVEDLQSGVSSEENYYSESSSDDANVVLKISANENLKIRGTVNEQNIYFISTDTPVVIKSRIDDTEWSGIVSSVNTKPETESNNDMYYYEEDSSDEMSKSSKYSFYVEPESFDGFRLGQHVIIELDDGQDDSITKTGIWLYSDFICKDGDKSYVWAKDEDGEIEKRYVEIGQIDEENGDCEIKSGLANDDYIAYPSADYEEGLTATTNASEVDVPENDLGGMEEGEEYYEKEYSDEETANEEINYEDYDFPTQEELNAMSEDELNEFFESMSDEELNAYLAYIEDTYSEMEIDENGEALTEEEAAEDAVAEE